MTAAARGLRKLKPQRVHFKVLKIALKLVWFSVYFSPNYKSIQVPMEQTRFEEISENL